MSATNYDIHLNYMLNANNASGGVDQLSKKLDGLSSVISRTRNMVAGYFGGQAAVKALIGYNADIENSVTALATTMFGFGKAASFGDAMKHSTKLAEEYREVAKRSLGESSDFIAMHQELQGVLLSQGVAYDKLKEIAIGATVASQIFGEEAGMTALDIKQMAMGTMTAKDRVGGLLVGMMAAQKGWKNFGFAEFNKLDPAKRIALLQEAVNSPALKEAAERMGKSFSGQWSTVTDNAKQIMGKAGKSLFEVLTSELAKVNDWLDKNKALVEKWSQSVGGALVTAFRVLGATFKFIADNASVFFALLKAFAAIKIAQGIGKAAASLKDAASSLKTSLGSFVAKFGGMRGGIGLGSVDGEAVSGPIQRNGLGKSIKSAGIANAIGGIVTAGAVGWELGNALREATGGTTAWADRMSGFFDTMGLGDKKTYDAVRAIERWEKALDASTNAQRERLAGLGVVASSNASVNLAGGLDLKKKEVAAIDNYLKARAQHEAMGGQPVNPFGSKKSNDAWIARDSAWEAAKALGLNERDLNAGSLEKMRADIARMEAKASFLQGDEAWKILNSVKSELPANVAAYLEERKAGGQGIDNLISAEMSKAFSKNGQVTAQAIRDVLMNMVPADIANAQDATNLNATKAKDEPTASKGNKVNVTIQRIEVQNDDPDRYVFDMMESFRKSAKNPSAARSIPRRG